MNRGLHLNKLADDGKPNTRGTTRDDKGFSKHAHGSGLKTEIGLVKCVVSV
jgi:hypothetical protein